jgi:hypothetical protein
MRGRENLGLTARIDKNKPLPRVLLIGRAEARPGRSGRMLSDLRRVIFDESTPAAAMLSR